MQRRAAAMHAWPLNGLWTHGEDLARIFDNMQGVVCMASEWPLATAVRQYYKLVDTS